MKSTENQTPVVAGKEMPAGEMKSQAAPAFQMKADAPQSAAMESTHGLIQAKLTVGEASSPAETEADSVAEAVTGQKLSAEAPSANAPTGDTQTASPQAEQHISAKKGGGKPLDKEVVDELGTKFGYDFSSVRIHEDGSAEAMNAYAYTVGSDIFFRPGLYNPHDTRGKALLAHELTHVVQNGAAGNKVQKKAADQKAESAAGISQFKEEKGADMVKHQNDAGTIRRCGGGSKKAPPKPVEAPWAPPTGQKLTTLDGTFGKFEVTAGLAKVPTTAAYGKYTITIEMTPNEKTKGSNIRFVQAVRRGTAPGSWAEKATDPGMTEDRAKRAAEGGWRIDRADPSDDKTPFYGHKINGDGNLENFATSRPGKFEGDKPMLYDGPGVMDPTALEFSANAVDDRTGYSYGSVAWGLVYNSSTKTYKEETPKLLSAGDSRLEGQEKAGKKWNEVYGKGGTVDESVNDLNVSKGTTNEEGVHFVSDWKKWDTTRIAKLPKGTQVERTKMNTDGSWVEVNILSEGDNKGKTGWIMNKFFTPAY